MGGFYFFEDDDESRPTIVSGYRLAYLYSKRVRSRMPKISTADIEDKGKSDFVAKIVVLSQFCWLAASLFTRKIKGLPSSQL